MDGTSDAMGGSWNSERAGRIWVRLWLCHSESVVNLALMITCLF
jgi:hypothetical protein